jgi:hypothetical protein
MLQLSGTGGEPRARWKFDTSPQQFVARRANRGSKEGQRELVALVVAHELHNNQLPGPRATLPNFIKQCTKVATDQCRAGVLGRQTSD